MPTPFSVHPGIGRTLAQKFQESFFEAYDRDADTWTALSYDTLNQLFEAIDEVGTDRTRIREHFAQTDSPEQTYRDVTGATYFDENGACLKPAYVAVVHNGKFEPAAEQIAIS